MKFNLVKYPSLLFHERPFVCLLPNHLLPFPSHINTRYSSTQNIHNFRIAACTSFSAAAASSPLASGSVKLFPEQQNNHASDRQGCPGTCTAGPSPGMLLAPRFAY
jgi:hypothetical protein